MATNSELGLCWDFLHLQNFNQWNKISALIIGITKHNNIIKLYKAIDPL